MPGFEDAWSAVAYPRDGEFVTTRRSFIPPRGVVSEVGPQIADCGSQRAYVTLGYRTRGPIQS